MSDTKFYCEYALVEHRPMSEGGANFFASAYTNLDEHPELWEKECPYRVKGGRIVRADDEGSLHW